MPQEYHVLKCFFCETFQVHIVKKTRKWECKVCGIKQSVKRNYGKGNAKDCRKQVMKLNEVRVLRGESAKTMEVDDVPDKSLSHESEKETLAREKPTNSKWAEFLEFNSENDESESESEGNASNCLNKKIKEKKRKKIMEKINVSSKKLCKDSNIEPSFDDVSKINQLLLPETNEKTFQGTSTVTKRKCFFPVDSELSEENNKKNIVETKSEVKQSKYAKYLNKSVGNNDLPHENKNLNIFGLNFDELDN